MQHHDDAQSAPRFDQDAPQWIDAGEAAKRLGVSLRSIQRRCASGTLPARRVEGPRGTVWQVEAGSVEGARHDERDSDKQDDTERDTKAQSDATATVTSATTGLGVALILPGSRSNERDTKHDSEGDTETKERDTATFWRDGDSDTAQSVALETERLRAQLEASRAEVERERELSRFLKSQIEEGNRNAQELRAALREALKAQPRQLERGTAAPEMAQERAPTMPTNTAHPTPEAVKAPPIAPETAGTTRSAARSILRALLGLR